MQIQTFYLRDGSTFRVRANVFNVIRESERVTCEVEVANSAAARKFDQTAFWGMGTFAEVVNVKAKS